MTDSPATVAVPVSALKSAANVSQTALKVTTGLAVFGSIFATIGPLLAMLSAASGLGVTATAIVHQLNLGASAEATTNAYIDSATNTATAVATSLGA